MSSVGAAIDTVSLTEESKLLPHATDKSIRVNVKAKQENNRRSTNLNLWLCGGVHDAGAGQKKSALRNFSENAPLF